MNKKKEISQFGWNVKVYSNILEDSIISSLSQWVFIKKMEIIFLSQISQSWDRAGLLNY